MDIKNTSLFINTCISILRLFILILMQTQGVQFKITAIEISQKQRLSLKNVSHESCII